MELEEQRATFNVSQLRLGNFDDDGLLISLMEILSELSDRHGGEKCSADCITVDSWSCGGCRS